MSYDSRIEGLHRRGVRSHGSSVGEVGSVGRDDRRGSGETWHLKWAQMYAVAPYEPLPSVRPDSLNGYTEDWSRLPNLHRLFWFQPPWDTYL